MKPRDYLQCLELITLRDDLSPSELHPALTTEVLTIERELGAELPEAYEEFLTEVGCGCEFGGVAWWYHLDITRPGNLLEVNQHLVREQAQAMRQIGRSPTEFPTGFLAVYDPCDGEVFGFQLNGGGRYAPAVWAWDTEEFELREVAPDMCHFLDYLLEGENVEAIERARIFSL